MSSLLILSIFTTVALSSESANITINLGVQKDASINWGSYETVEGAGSWGTTPFTVPTPDADKSCVWAPLTLKTNTDLTLTVYEGLSQWLKDSSGVPWDGIWDADTDYSFVWAPGINITTQAEAENWPNSPGLGGGPVFNNSEGRGSIPGSGGKAGMYTHIDLVRGSEIPSISSGVSGIIFDGSYTFGVWLNVDTGTEVNGGVDWTSLGANETGTFDLYAVLTNL